MHKKVFAFVLAAALLCTVAFSVAAATFTDVAEDAYYADAAERMGQNIHTGHLLGEMKRRSLAVASRGSRSSSGSFCIGSIRSSLHIVESES